MMRNAGRLSTFFVLVAAASIARGATVTLSIPSLNAQAGAETEVPVNVKNAKGISALQALLTYDPKVLEVVAEADKAMTRGKILPENAIAKVFTNTPGRLPIVFLGGADPNQKRVFAVEEDGTLLTIRFRVIGSGQTLLKLEKAEAFEVNDIDMLVKTEDGTLTVGGGLPWLWIIVGVAVLLILLFLATRRRRPVPRAAPLHAAAGSQTAPAGGATFQHHCTKCGAVLTLPVLFAGKQVQCSGCGISQIATP